MTCPRCDGLLVEDWDTTVGTFEHCLNCGGVMPKFKTEEDRLAWKEKCRMTREANQKKKGTAVAHTESREEFRKSHGVGGIAGALDEIDSKIAALQQVRKTLLHAQELVMA